MSSQEASVAESEQSTVGPTSAQQSSAQPTSSASPTTEASSEAPASSTPQPSSASPSSSSSQAQSSSSSESQIESSSSSAAPTSSSAVPSSSVESSAAPSSSLSSASPSPVASTASSTSAVAAATSAVSSASASASSTSDLVTQTATSTDASGKVYTITQVVHNPTATLSTSTNNSESGFFNNTGAVAGTFVVVGLAITAGIIAFFFFMLKRRRRQRLDRDVAAAASAAAAASHHRGFDDEEEKGVAMTEYGNNGYAGTDVHGEPVQQMGQYDYEDPTGGYDAYAHALPLPGDRVSTATAPGLAGFGAVSAQDRFNQQQPVDQYQGYSDNPNYTEEMGYNALTREEAVTAPQEGYYFDPAQAAAFDTPSQDPYQDDLNAYGENEYPLRTRVSRTFSTGSVLPGGGGHDERGLKVTNV